MHENLSEIVGDKIINSFNDKKAHQMLVQKFICMSLDEDLAKHIVENFLKSGQQWTKIKN